MIDIHEYEKIIYPYVDSSYVSLNRFGKLRKISKPVLSIMGKNSRQGKFTLQLQIRKKFLEEGYNIAQISTEPTGYLFGMDFSYPNGYNSSVFVNTYDTVNIINEKLKVLQKPIKKTDKKIKFYNYEYSGGGYNNPGPVYYNLTTGGAIFR